MPTVPMPQGRGTEDWLSGGRIIAIAFVVMSCQAVAGPDFSRYPAMSCGELSAERNLLRLDLVRLQSPAWLEDGQWNVTRNAYGVVNRYIDERHCRPLSAEEQMVPDPGRIDLLPERQLVELALRAYRNQRYRAGEVLLLQGSLAGYAEAQYNLGMFYAVQKQTTVAEQWLRSAAQQGHTGAAQALQSIGRKAQP